MKVSMAWSAGLDSFAPEFETYWMNFLYIEFVFRSLYGWYFVGLSLEIS